MTKREVVCKALNFEDVPYVPCNFSFTQEAGEKLKNYLESEDIEDG